MRYFSSTGKEAKTGRPLHIHMVVDMTFATGIPTGFVSSDSSDREYKFAQRSERINLYYIC